MNLINLMYAQVTYAGDVIQHDVATFFFQIISSVFEIMYYRFFLLKK